MKQPQTSYLRPVRASGRGAVPVTAGKGACAGRSAGLQSRGDGSFLSGGSHTAKQQHAPRLSGNTFLGHVADTSATVPAALTSCCPAAQFPSGRVLLLSLPRTACGTAQGRRSPSNPLAGGAPHGEAGTHQVVAQQQRTVGRDGDAGANPAHLTIPGSVAQSAEPWDAGSSPARSSFLASVAERLSHLPVEQAPQRASQVRVLPDAPSFSGAGVSSAPLLNRQTHVAAAPSGMPCGLAESVRRAPSGGAGSGATRDTGRGDFLIRRDDDGFPGQGSRAVSEGVVAPAFTHPRRHSSANRERRDPLLTHCPRPERMTPAGTGGAGNPSSGNVR